jgi:hypothetical protein
MLTRAILLSLALPAAAFAAPDAIFLNGKVFTAEDNARTVTAFAVEGSRFTATGSDADIRKLAGQNTRIIDDRDREPWFVIFDTARELTLLDLRGIWTTKAGASAAINSGPKRRAQDWSRTFYEAYPKIDGIIYPSSMGGNADAVALYERAKSALPVRPRFHRALSGRELRPALARAAEAIGYARI